MIDTRPSRSNASFVACRVIATGLAAATLVLALSASGSAAEAAPSRPVSRPVSFVPLGSFPRSDAAKLAHYIEQRLGLRTSVVSRIALARSAFDRTRRQYVAEELIDVVAPLRAAASSQGVFIGLTVEDMYSRDRPDWRFAFSTRHPSGLAVVSRARMDPRLFGLAPDAALRIRRLRKMVLKNIGVLALGLPQSRNPRSALYDSILSGDDLDYMTEEFRPRAPSHSKQVWLARSTRLCKQGVAEAKALSARSPLVTREDLLAYADMSIALADVQRAQLAAIPAAAEERLAVRALLARFKRAGKADRAAVAKLRAQWSDATLKRWLQDALRSSLALKSNALELGSRSCGRYFDPATYVR